MSPTLHGKASFGGNLSLSGREFSRLSRLLTQKTGILFSTSKQRDVQLKISSELEMLSELARGTFIDELERSDQMLQNIINKLTIGESYFFRNRPHFSVLREKILPDLIKRNKSTRRIKIWCAGCSTGEEPYSLAILLKQYFPRLENWEISITATDINTAFLKRAKEAVYSSWSFRGVKQEIIDRYFQRENPNLFRLNKDIASSVNFDLFNLSILPFTDRFGPEEFDLVMCRNVLIYFSFEFSNNVIAALSEMLVPRGYLIVGHSESFPALGDLDVVYSHATYYYQRPLKDNSRNDFEQSRPTLSIPGIGVHDIERRPSLMPPSVSVGAAMDHAKNFSLERELETAQNHSDMGETGEARTILDSLLRGDGNLDYKVHFLASVIADQENRTADALTHLKQAIFLKKEFIVGHYYQGVICEREGDKTTAARCFRNVIRLIGQLPDNLELDEGGGITAKRLQEIASERVRELNL